MAWLLCACYVAPVGADGDVIATDRPSVTASSTIVPRRALQIEGGLQATDSAGQWTLDLPQLLLRFGLLESTELRLVVPDYFLELPLEGSSIRGFGDLGLGVSYSLVSSGGFDLAVIPLLGLPTGARRISSGGYDPALELPWSRELSPRWTVAGQLASFWRTVDGARNQTSELTLLLERQLHARWNIFVEYAADVPQHGGASELLHLGTTYKPSPHQQIDLHVGVGLTHAAPTSFVGIGYSYLCPTH